MYFNVYFPHFSHEKCPHSTAVWAFLYLENHSLGEWFKKGCCR